MVLRSVCQLVLRLYRFPFECATYPAHHILGYLLTVRMYAREQPCSFFFCSSSTSTHILLRICHQMSLRIRNQATHTVMVKFNYNLPWSHRRGLEVWFYSLFNLSAGWRWAVDATSRPLYPRKWRRTHCIWNWLGPRASYTPVQNISWEKCLP